MECSTEESYASRAARTAGPAPATNRNVSVNNSNHLPGRPCTAFSLLRRIPAQLQSSKPLIKQKSVNKIFCVYTGGRAGRCRLPFVQKL